MKKWQSLYSINPLRHIWYIIAGSIYSTFKAFSYQFYQFAYNSTF
jgi:hypothetical protein